VFFTDFPVTIKKKHLLVMFFLEVISDLSSRADLAFNTFPSKDSLSLKAYFVYLGLYCVIKRVFLMKAAATIKIRE
jgi:hypothetical protein